MMPLPLALAFAFLFGLSVGSFLNVVIARLPAGRSIVRPGSSCPRCGSAIAWYDNVPLLSYALLRARCRSCQAWISWRYPAIEFTCGAVSYTHLRAHETPEHLVCRLLLEK